MAAVKKKRPSLKKSTPATLEKKAREVLGANDVAPPRVLEEDPSDPISQTSTYIDEDEALDAKTDSFHNIFEIEQSLAFLARKLLHHYLRSHKLTPADKCRFSLDAIRTLEGSKQFVSWRDEMSKKPKSKSFEIYKAKKEEMTDRLKQVLMREKEFDISVAEKALDEIRKQNGDDGDACDTHDTHDACEKVN